MKKLIVMCWVFSLVAAVAIGGMLNHYIEYKPFIDNYYNYTANVQDVSVEQACMWLDRAANSHESGLLDDSDGFDQGCIDRYASIKRLILKLEAE